MRTNVISMVALMVTAAGCGALPDDGGVEPQRSALVNTRWRLGSADYIVGWSSGNTNSLSAWKSISCPGKYGTQFLLTALTGYREPAGNLDNFIAKLQATCTEFNVNSQYTSTVFSGPNYRSTAYELDVLDWQTNSDLLCPAFYFSSPTGNAVVGRVELALNPGSDYVQDFRLYPLCARWNSDDTITWFDAYYGVTNAMMSSMNFSNTTTLSCPNDNYAATGVELRYDTRNGKIREFRLVCRSLTLN